MDRSRKTRPPPGEQFKQLSASSYGHSACGLTLNGDVVCWGERVPWALPRKEGPFTQVATGNRVTCGIREDTQRVECWGLRSVDAAVEAAGGTDLPRGHQEFEQLSAG